MSAGQAATSRGARIAGIVSAVPSRIVQNEHFLNDFGVKTDEIAKMTGVRERRWVTEDQTTADLCEAAAGRLLEDLRWDRESVEGLIFISQTPDYRLPATACAMHGRLGLRPGALAFDVNLGCSGYPYGLWLAMTAVQTGAASRILLAVGDTISKTVDMRDRSTAMLFGDAGTVTAIERGAVEDDEAHFLLGTDGRGERKLIIPRGGYRNLEPALFPEANLDALYMDGGEIFNFTLGAVPKLIRQTVANSGVSLDSYDYFLMHQANEFMIKHITKKAKLPEEKVPINIGRYGNTSSATIPLLLTDDLAPALRNRSLRLGLFGFGVGFSWASASLNVGPLSCVETIVA